MLYETIDLYAYFKTERKGATAGMLSCYRHGQIPEMRQKTYHPAMLVLPGGGYGFVSQREGEPVVLEYFSAGFDVFLLKYDIAPACYPLQFEQVAMAMMYIRRNAEAFDIIPDKIAAIGFSAGGHLLGCISTKWDDDAVRALFGDECDKVRPDASVYSYAVVSSDPSIYHDGTFRNFCGDRVSPDDYSVEKLVRPQCSPAFIWCNTPDKIVPVQNSLRLYEAYLAAGVPAELHIFRAGWHGMSVCNEEIECNKPVPPEFALVRPWIGLSRSFLKSLGFDYIKGKREN